MGLGCRPYWGLGKSLRLDFLLSHGAEPPACKTGLMINSYCSLNTLKNLEFSENTQLLFYPANTY